MISFIDQKNSRKPPLDAYVPAVVFVRRCLLFFSPREGKGITCVSYDGENTFWGKEPWDMDFLGKYAILLIKAGTFIVGRGCLWGKN